jgi:hypothetical protein
VLFLDGPDLGFLRGLFSSTEMQRKTVVSGQ